MLDRWQQDRIVQAIATAADQTQAALRRPFVLMRPRMFIDGNQWCALYGENLQDGVAGFGTSPAAASEDFDRAWYEKLPTREAPEQAP